MDKTSETRKVGSIINRTISDLSDTVNDCKMGLEMIASFEEYHELIKDGKPNPAVFEPLKIINHELFQLKEKIMTYPSVLHLWHIFQSFETSFEMKKSFLMDQFHSDQFAKLKSLLILKKWFGIMGQLALSTEYSIKKTSL